MAERSNSVMAWPAAIHRGVLVGVLMVVGYWAGDLRYGAAAGLGAWSVGLVPPGISRASLVRLGLGTSVTCAAAGLVSLLAADSWWLLLVLPVLGYVYGAAGGTGTLSFNLTMAPLAAAVGLSATAHSGIGPVVGTAVALLLGGLVAAVIGLLTWPFERIVEARRAAAHAVIALRDMVAAQDITAPAHLNCLAALGHAEQVLVDTDLPARQYDHVFGVITAAGDCLPVISSWLAGSRPRPQQRETVADLLLGIADMARHPAKTGSSEATRALAVVESGPVRDCLSALTDACEGASGQDQRSKGPGAQPGGDQTLWQWAAGLPSLLGPAAAGSKAGLRLAVALACATVVNLAFDIPRGYWIAMTIALVLKPDFSTTLTKSGLRIAGTCVGVLVVAVVFALTGEIGWVYVALITIAAPLAMRWMSANYFWAASATTVTMVLLAEAEAPSIGPPMARLEMTLLGSLIAVAVFLILPSWRGEELQQAVATMVRTQMAWTGGVLDRVTGQCAYPVADLGRLGAAARAAFSRAQLTAAAANVEPHRTAWNPACGVDLVVACGATAMATRALQDIAAEDADGATSQFPAQTLADLATYRTGVLGDLGTALLLLEHRPDPVALPSVSQRSVGGDGG
ncbi:MAG: FUSC family protein, partial [Actinomycetes bacterium]